jgi:hypothetical protein
MFVLIKTLKPPLAFDHSTKLKRLFGIFCWVHNGTTTQWKLGLFENVLTQWQEKIPLQMITDVFSFVCFKLFVIVLVICERTLKVIDGIALNEIVCDKTAHFIS